VDEQKRPHLRLVLEALDVVAVAAPDRLPVDAADVVAGRVLLVLRKLDRRPGVRILVHARERPLDDDPRAHAHRGEARDVGRTQRQRLAGPGPRFRLRVHYGRIASTSRSTSACAVNPSASAWKFGSTRCTSTGAASVRTSSMDAA